MMHKLMNFFWEIVKYGFFAGLEYIFFKVRDSLSRMLDKTARPSQRANPSRSSYKSNGRYSYNKPVPYDDYYDSIEEAF